MNKTLIVVGIVLVAVLGAWFMMSSKAPAGEPAKTTTTTTTGGSEEATSVANIQIKDFKYSPATLTVKAGETVTVKNLDITGHSVTADDGSFDSGVLSQNQSGKFTAPSKPGTYKFHCTPHPSIVGTLIVQ